MTCRFKPHCSSIHCDTIHVVLQTALNSGLYYMREFTDPELIQAWVHQACGVLLVPGNSE